MGIWIARKGYLLVDSTNPCADQMLEKMFYII